MGDSFDISGENRLDCAVLAVADPAVYAMVLRLPDKPGAKAYTLDPAADDDMCKMVHRPDARTRREVRSGNAQ